MEEEKEETVVETPLVHNFESEKRSIFTPALFTALVIVIVLGVGSGYFLSQRSVKVGGVTIRGNSSSSIPSGTVVGSSDTKTFKDTAEGILKTGGIDGEGQYHLVRPGGDSQNVYLTSSIVDLSKFVDEKIKVWGQTQKAQHAGWLMDIGRVEVLGR